MTIAVNKTHVLVSTCDAAPTPGSGELSFRLSSPNCDTKIGQRLKVIYYSSSCNLLDSRRRSAALLLLLLLLFAVAVCCRLWVFSGSKECRRFCAGTSVLMSPSACYSEQNYVEEERSTLQAPTVLLAAPEPRTEDSAVSRSNATVSVWSEGPYKSCG